MYSYSRLSNYENCPRAFFYTYIKRDENKQNVYSFIGSAVHEILERLQKREIDKDEALKIFENAVTEADILGYEWMSESVRDKYIAAIKHYLQHYKPIECDEYFIEEYFEIPVGDKWMKGYIDLYTITDGVIDIYDYKTSSSSSFTGKDAYKKMRQMILYGIAIKQKYPDMPIRSMNFDMLKYYKVPSKRSKLGYTLKDRSTIDILDFTTEFKPAYISADFTDEVIEEVTKYVCDTVNKIESLDDNIESYEKGLNPNKDFFCKTLCGFRDRCLNK